MKTSFEKLVASDKPVLIDFYAEWCGPCKAMSPILRDVAKKIGDKARVVKIDVDKNNALASRLNIRGVPTLMVFKQGEIKWQRSGMQSATALLQVLNQFVQADSIVE